MEGLFSPCTRRRDRDRQHPYFEDDGYDHWAEAEAFEEEVEMTEAGAHSLRFGAWRCADFFSFVCEKLVWVSADVCIDGRIIVDHDDFGFMFRGLHCVTAMKFDDYGETGDALPDEFRIFAASSPQARIDCDHLLECLSPAFDGGELTFQPGDFDGDDFPPVLPFSAPALSNFFTRSLGSRRLRFDSLGLDTDQCRVLAAVDPTGGLEIELHRCELTDDGSSAILEGVRNSRGLSALVDCYYDIDYPLLVQALRGSTSFKKLELTDYWCQNDDYALQDVQMQYLAENLGLVDLNFFGVGILNKLWCAMCRALSTHPSVEKLDLRKTRASRYYSLEEEDDDDDDNDDDFGVDDSSLSTVDFERQDERRMANRKTRRTNALVDMLRSNTKITTLRLTRHEFDENLLDNQVSPRLKLNEYSPRFRALRKTEGSLRGPLLGRALQAVCDEPSLLLLLLSQNADINWAALRCTRRSRKRVRYTK